MIRSLYTVNRNMNILQKKQENTSSNIANVKTSGYKFQDIVQSTLESKEMINYSGGRKNDRRQELGAYTFGNEIDEYYRNFEQGSVVQTNNTTDFAIVGRGFFTVQTNDEGMAFTRNGNFRVNEDNQLVTMEGYPVLGVNANGEQDYIYLENGQVSSANLLISDFANYDNLTSIGDTLFTSPQANEIINGEIRQGFLEMSNVDIASELVKMIEISREFEANQKLLHSADETLNKAVNELGRV